MEKHLHAAQISQAAASISAALRSSGIRLNGALSDFEQRRLGELVFDAAEKSLCKYSWFRDGDRHSKERHLRSTVELVPDLPLAG
jgi:hypothetical protein